MYKMNVKKIYVFACGALKNEELSSSKSNLKLQAKTFYIEGYSDVDRKNSKHFFLGMLDFMMWPWLERLPMLDCMGISLPEFQTLKVYMDNMWGTGNSPFSCHWTSHNPFFNNFLY